MPSLHPSSPRWYIVIFIGVSCSLAFASCQSNNPDIPTLRAPSQSAVVETPTATSTAGPPSDTPILQQTVPSNTALPAWVTVVPTFTLVPAETGQPGGDLLFTPTRTRQPTPSTTPPYALLRIQKPGSYSKVSSPIQLKAVVNPGEDKRVYIDLVGENGRLITSQFVDFIHSNERYVYIATEIPFEISELAETSRLVLYTLDRFGRTIYQTSVDLILLRIGDSDINQPVVEMEPYMISKPWEGATVTGGMMTVEGQVRLVNDQPLIIELFDEQGNLVGSAEAQLDQPNELQTYVPFTMLVPYTVTKWTPIRLTARQMSATRIPGTVWLSSVKLYLEP